MPESSTEFKAQCLDPGVTYRFQVLAFTEAGDGPHTAIFACSTLESASSRAARWKESQKWSKEKAGGRGGRGGAASASASASAPAPVSEPEPVPGPELEVDWKQLRASGQHKSKRASKDGWMKKPSASVSRMVQVEQIDVGPLGTSAGVPAGGGHMCFWVSAVQWCACTTLFVFCDACVCFLLFLRV